MIVKGSENWLNIVVVGMLLLVTFSLHAKDTSKEEHVLEKPLIERYILDELKSIRNDQERLRAELSEKVAEAKLQSSDRAIRYTADTTNNIFYIITAAASLLVLIGWKSLREIKESVKSSTVDKLNTLTKEYEERLGKIEMKMKERSQVILETQEKISNTEVIQSLWRRAALEKSAEEKLTVYDEILELKPDDIEALAYKADALLEIGEVRWALSLSDAAIEKDAEYALAYWQRACAYAQMDRPEEALDDIESAISLSDTLRDELIEEPNFKKLEGVERFEVLKSL